MMKKNMGFTLIEMIVVVVIMGILIAIAVPRYKLYIIRGNRAAVQADMMQIAANLERYKAMQLTYANAALTGANNVYGSSTFPLGSSGSKVLYNLTLGSDTGNTPTATYWLLTATPNAGSPQKGNGAMMLDSMGRRCWNPSSDTTCTITDTTQGWNNQ